MLVATAFAIAFMAGQEPTVIGNAAGNRTRATERSSDQANRSNTGTGETEEICRDVPVTGSRFPRRVCATRQQATQEREEGRSMLRRMQGSRLPDGR